MSYFVDSETTPTRWKKLTTWWPDCWHDMLLLLLSRFSCVWLCATPQTAAHQAPLSLRFSRQEHWSGLPFPSPCMKVKIESDVAQSCPTLSDPMDCSPPGSSIHGIFQARVLEWGAIAFSWHDISCHNSKNWPQRNRNKLRLELKTNCPWKNQDEADQTTAWPISRWLSELIVLFLHVTLFLFLLKKKKRKQLLSTDCQFQGLAFEWESALPDVSLTFLFRGCQPVK